MIGLEWLGRGKCSRAREQRCSDLFLAGPGRQAVAMPEDLIEPTSYEAYYLTNAVKNVLEVSPSA
jgi:hypothetical protein